MKFSTLNNETFVLEMINQTFGFSNKDILRKK